MKVVIAPDSFKGSLPAVDFCRIVAAAAARARPGVVTVPLPVADGGEGFVDALLHAHGGERCEELVTGPGFQPVQASYAVLAGGGTAVIEMAAASGLPLLGGRLDPLGTTTLGTGELLRAALDRGCREILLGLGGSATTDGGAGAAMALGARLLDHRGREIHPSGAGLGRLARIDLSGLDPRLGECELRAACDVDNPLHGTEGAALVFGPQKGAGPAEVEALDANLRRFGELLARDFGRHVAQLRGAGAAGGLGAGVAGLLGFRLEPGAELVLDAVGLDEALAGAGLVITGEGTMDRQSLRGKAPVAVARRAARAGVPVLALVGRVGEGVGELHAVGVTAVLAIHRGPVSQEEALAKTREALAGTAEEAIRLWSYGDSAPNPNGDSAPNQG